MDELTDRINALKRTPLLAGLPHSELEQMAKKLKVEGFDSGAELIKEGTSGNSAFFIVAGTCDVRRKGARLSTLGPGDFFGELSIIDPAPRTATVTAAEPVVVMQLDGYDFETALKQNKSMALQLVKTLASRLRDVVDEFSPR